MPDQDDRNNKALHQPSVTGTIKVDTKDDARVALQPEVCSEPIYEPKE